MYEYSAIERTPLSRGSFSITKTNQRQEEGTHCAFTEEPNLQVHVTPPTEVVGDNLIMLDKRTDGGHSMGNEHNDQGIEGLGGADASLGEASPEMPF